jgi:hypothetical protein
MSESDRFVRPWMAGDGPDADVEVEDKVRYLRALAAGAARGGRPPSFVQ